MCLQKPVFCFKNNFWTFGVLNVLKGGLTDLVLNSDTEAGSILSHIRLVVKVFMDLLSSKACITKEADEVA